MINLKNFFVFFIMCLVTFTAETVSAQSERSKGFALQKGDCIGILAPSAYLKGLADSEGFKRAVNFFQSRGYRVKIAPYELDGTGALLLIEDVGEKPYRLDRMLYQLYQSGLLNRVNGILFGDFTNCKKDKANGLTLENVLEHYAKLSGKPTIMGLPAGHDKHNTFLPLGVHAIMKADSNGKAKLIIDEPTFKS
ncbi:MAG: hypothetical protein IKZ58_03085 [Selenomonadaceae bacterium]|nr:hypothetical protein [Selenomonadaceae bacterium]